MARHRKAFVTCVAFIVSNLSTEIVNMFIIYKDVAQTYINKNSSQLKIAPNDEHIFFALYYTNVFLIKSLFIFEN